MFRRVLATTALSFSAVGIGIAYIVLPQTEAATATESPVITVLPSTTASPVVTTAAPSTTNPKPAVNQEVKATQEKLNALGYWAGKPDGKAGASTAQAVMAFQKVEGLPRTGKLDAATLAKLASARRPTAPRAGDVVVIDKSLQVIFVIRDGETRYVFNTSTGTEKAYNENGRRGVSHTPVGEFTVIRQVNKVDPGPLGSLYRPKYLTTNGIAVHGAASIPGYPASHGCARVSNAVMDLIWTQDLMPMGGEVAIVN